MKDENEMLKTFEFDCSRCLRVLSIMTYKTDVSTTYLSFHFHGKNASNGLLRARNARRARLGVARPTTVISLAIAHALTDNGEAELLAVRQGASEKDAAAEEMAKEKDAARSFVSFPSEKETKDPRPPPLLSVMMDPDPEQAAAPKLSDSLSFHKKRDTDECSIEIVEIDPDSCQLDLIKVLADRYAYISQILPLDVQRMIPRFQLDASDDLKSAIRYFEQELPLMRHLQSLLLSLIHI